MDLILLPGIKYFTSRPVAPPRSDCTDDTKSTDNMLLSLDEKSKTLDRFYSSDIFDRNVLPVIHDFLGMLRKTSSRCVADDRIEICYINARYEVKVEIRIRDGRSDDCHKMVILVFDWVRAVESRYEYGLYTNTWIGNQPLFELIDIIPGNYEKLSYYAMRMMHDMSREMLKVYCKPADIHCSMLCQLTGTE